MWWRREAAEWGRGKGAGNRNALRRLVRDGEVPGLMAYVAGEPAGWIALAPREAYPRLARARTLRPIDDKPVWSVTCFFVARAHRKRGLTVQLLEAAARHARSRGCTLLEGYPVDTGKARLADAWVFTGLAGAFRRAGFKEVARPARTRPIMRRALRPQSRA
jgi:GNAT superfamily N-acetyltransferase